MWMYTHGALLSLSNLLVVMSTVLFAMGFYRPMAPLLGRTVPVHEVAKSEDAPFQKLVFMTVDALRRLVPSQQCRRSSIDIANPHTKE